MESLEPKLPSGVVSRCEKLQDIVANVVGPLANFLREVMEKGIRRITVISQWSKDLCAWEPTELAMWFDYVVIYTHSCD